MPLSVFSRELVKKLKRSIGIDIGGTKIAGALVNDSGTVLREIKVPSPTDDSEQMVQAIASVISDLAEDADAVGVGVAAAGFLSADREIMYLAPNISVWRNEPLKALIESKVKLPVLLENDANAAGWAEFRFGAGVGVSSMIMLTIGTGVGGAIISDSQLQKGGFGIGAELGHVRSVSDGKQCGCGNKGCLESYASGTALLQAARSLANSDKPAGFRLKQLQQEHGELAGEQVYQAITESDPGALELIDELGYHLGDAIGSIFVPVLDPELVVIGGGVSAVGDVLLDPIRRAYLQALPAKGYRPELEIVKAKFLNQAGIIGAADLAQQKFD